MNRAGRAVRRRRPRLVTRPFLLVAGASLAYFLADGVLLPAVPLYVEGPLRGSDIAVGVSVGAFSVTALVLRPWAGRLGDRRGRRLLMLVGAGVFGASTAAYVLAGSVPAMLGLRLLTGAGEAFFFTGAASAINDLAPEERRGEAVSFFSLALYAGIGAGPLLGEAMVSQGRFAAAWLIAGGLAAVAVALSVMVPETRPEGAGRASTARLIHPAALLPGSALLASVSGMAGFFAFVPLYAPRIGLGGSRFVFLTFSAVVVVIRLFGARIPDVLGPVRASRAAMAISALGLGVTGLWRSPVGLFAGTVVLAIGAALAFPGLMLLAVRGAPASERGAVVGTFTAFVDLGFGAGPAALGFVADVAGYPSVFLTAGLVAVGGFALLLARGRQAEVGRPVPGEAVSTRLPTPPPP
jgi:MFS family permease